MFVFNFRNRKINTNIVRQLRNSLFESGRFEDMSDNYEVIRERDIEGTWIERGSNNLAGRIMTADIDFNIQVAATHYCYMPLYLII